VSNSSVLIRGLVALGVTAMLTPAVLALLRRGRVLDAPNHRSLHRTPTPRGAGLAPAVGCLCALALTPAAGTNARAALGIVGVAFGAIGLAEDLHGIPPLRRLALHVLAAAVGLRWLLVSLRGPLVWQVVFGVGVLVWIVAYVNAFNFMDGINGISAAQATIAGAGWCALGLWRGAPGLAAAGAILAGACLGFAPFNFPKARVFLGDTGSYFLGAWMAVTVVIGLRAGLSPEAVIFPVAIYLADTSSTIVSRLRRGERWYEPHREHVYQRLCISGWSHTCTTATVSGFIALVTVLGFVSESGRLAVRIPADAAALALLVVYLGAPRLVSRLAAPTMA
jgi:UDP-GlcNAc:undecaprenyl-phosphate/decaprenyl-phosphate GlcNAc-1-phosphate transferase